jgi:deazaflavin-dependent oxidoreductase (nitroreductase family)
MTALYGQDHVDRYRETNGEEGHDWNGTSILLLTTTGAKSGEPRTAPLIYGVNEAGEPMVVASKGGSDTPPAWYVNLERDPAVEVQLKDDVYEARARTATPEERERWWPIMVGEWSDYDEYQAKTDREIPIVVLERV